MNSLEWRELFPLAATLSPLPFPMGTPPICRSVQKAERGGMVRSVANCPVVVGAERPATEPTPSPPPLFLEVINSIGLYSIGPKESLSLSLMGTNIRMNMHFPLGPICSHIPQWSYDFHNESDILCCAPQIKGE